jgi:hypothetical protein
MDAKGFITKYYLKPGWLNLASANADQLSSSLQTQKALSSGVHYKTEINMHKKQL